MILKWNNNQGTFATGIVSGHFFWCLKTKFSNSCREESGGDANIRRKGNIGGSMILLASICSLVLFTAGILALYKLNQAWLSVTLFVFTVLASAALLVMAAILSIEWPERTGRVLESGQYTILYREDEGQLADEVRSELHQVEPKVSELLGEAPEARLTVRFSDRLLGEVADQSAGIYNWEASTATLLSGTSDWRSVLLHEYVHYRSHQYQTLHGTPRGSMPSWFEEGLAMYVQHPLAPADPDEVEISGDLREFASHKDFLAAPEHTDIYAQSYFAVAHLIERYGKEPVLLLLHSSSQDQFYARLEKLTGKSSADFSDSLMNAYRKDGKQMQETVRHFQDRLFKEDFEGAAQVLADWSAAEGSRTAKEVEDYRRILLLHAEEWKELMYSLEQKRAFRPYDMDSFDYALLAELTLLFHSERASGLVQEALTNLPEDATSSHMIRQWEEPYEQVAGTHPLQGYRALFEKELFFNQAIRAELLAKWQKEFPNEDFGERSGD
ncbi:peptidase MA family metallohydrolase [Bhargavaea changchunensis]|uniref:Peptidase MA family metallohydrolase n=1 Tax=Bhargavaea changchunensis TaxID=2134037 RepID=A0ABW2N8K7_9BACL